MKNYYNIINNKISKLAKLSLLFLLCIPFTTNIFLNIISKTNNIYNDIEEVTPLDDIIYSEHHSFGLVDPLIEFKQQVDLNYINIPYYSQKDYSYYFFYNSYVNNIKNSIGNCGYTAISMLLSYYDSYWNDNIILEAYDSGVNLISNNDMGYYIDAPGIIDNSVFSYSKNVEELSKKEKDSEIRNFINQVISNKENSFFGLLLSYAISNGYYSTKSLIDDLGVNYKIMTSTLNSYIENNLLLNENVTLISSNAEVDKVSTNVIRNKIIEKLKEGEPVIVGGNGYNDLDTNGIQSKDEKTIGHVCIAYDYDEENDIIYGNLGWGIGSIIRHNKKYYAHHMNLDDYFNLGFKDYFYFDLKNISHSHSNNYFNESTNDYMCSCKLKSHVHNYKYLSKDENQHYKKCICYSSNILENHYFASSYVRNGNEYTLCGGCNYAMLTTNIPSHIV